MRIPICILLILSTSLIGSSQDLKFENEDFDLKIEMNYFNDSLNVSIDLLNKTDKSFYHGSEAVSYWWSVSQKNLALFIGTDLKHFTENIIDVHQIRAMNSMKRDVKIPCSNKDFILFLNLSFFISKGVKEDISQKAKVTGKDSDWLWANYYIPLSLK